MKRALGFQVILWDSGEVEVTLHRKGKFKVWIWNKDESFLVHVIRRWTVDLVRDIWRLTHDS